MFYKNNDILPSVFTLPHRKSAVGQGLYDNDAWHFYRVLHMPLQTTKHAWRSTSLTSHCSSLLCHKTNYLKALMINKQG